MHRPGLVESGAAREVGAAGWVELVQPARGQVGPGPALQLFAWPATVAGSFDRAAVRGSSLESPSTSSLWAWEGSLVSRGTSVAAFRAL